MVTRGSCPPLDPYSASSPVGADINPDFKPFKDRKGALAFIDRVWREIHINFGTTNLGLKEDKDLVDGAPGTVKEGISQKDAEDAKQKLEEVGATVEIK